MHTKDFALEKIVPQVIAAVKPFEKVHRKDIPVITAGGVYTGRDIHKYLIEADKPIFYNLAFGGIIVKSPESRHLPWKSPAPDVFPLSGWLPPNFGLHPSF